MPDTCPIWISTIKNKKYKLFNGKTTMNAVEIYKYLIDRFDKVDVSKDPDFQEAYIKFFKTSLGSDRQIKRPAGEKWHESYFELLQSLKQKDKSELDITTELTKFYDMQVKKKLNAKVEVSFISKALHMVNHNLPIWDRNVRKTLLGLKSDPVAPTKNVAKKIEKAEKFYNLTKEKIQEAIDNDKTKDEQHQIIGAFRKAFKNEENGITDVKVMDFYYWITYKLQTKKKEK